MSKRRRYGLRAARPKCFQIEGLERRLLLSSALARFTAEQTFGVGLSPNAVVAADLNGDGKVDLVTANYYGNSVSVLLGNGNGTFHAEQEFPAGKHPLGVAVADVNGDGKPDLIATNSYNGTVSVLLGNGNGTFQSQRTFSAGSGAATVIAADVNGDGKPDLIVTNQIAYTVSVLLGNGNGTFQAQRTFAVGSFPRPLAVADLNGDGNPDLVVGNNGATTISILLGNGNGTFQAQQTVNVAVAPSGLALADLNADGKLDLVVASSQSSVSAVGVLLGNGNGTFQARQTFGTGRSPSSVAVADFNGDGKPDLAVTNYSNQTVGVLLGNGNGTFLPQQTTAVSTFPGHITAADLDGDGIPDLVAVQQGTDSVGVLLNRTPPQVLSINRTNPVGASTSDPSVTFTVTFNKPVTGVNLADFSIVANGVGFSSAAFATLNSSVYTVTVGGISGKGTLGLNLVDNATIHDLAGNPLVGGAASFSSPAATGLGAPYNDLAVADLNGDGKPDLAFIGTYYPPHGYPQGRLAVVLGNGNGTFGKLSRMTFATTAEVRRVVAADLNGDGQPDLAIMDDFAGAVLLGNGNGTFRPPQTFAAGVFPGDFAVGDLNGDGKPDLAVVDGFNSVSTLLGNGNGTFQAPQSFAAGPKPFPIAIADVNGDGAADLVVANGQGGHLEVLLGNGNGTFRAEQTFGLGSGYYQSIAVADLNGDGKPDILADNRYGSIDVFLGNGNGTFQPQQNFAASPYQYNLVLADVNGDGNPDAIVNSRSTVSFLMGNGNGTLRPQQTINARPGLVVVAVADVTGDGIPDLITLSADYIYRSGSFSVLLGMTNGSLAGQTYTIIPVADTITGTAGNDSISLVADPDGVHIDWTLTPSIGSPTTGELPINDPNGLTILGNGGDDTITLDYTRSDPLPNTLHMNGTFTINNLTGANPFAGTTLDIGRSTAFITYAGVTSDPILVIKSYLQGGYNGGAWNGTPTSTTGVISSSALPANQGYAIGFADSADGVVTGQPANTVELKYTLAGDLTLAGTVNFADFAKVVADYGKPDSWDGGAFTYGTTVSFADFALTVANYGKQAVTSDMSLAAVDEPPASQPAAQPVMPSSAPTSSLAVHVVPARKRTLRHRHR